VSREFNEGKACDAVARLLEQRTGTVRQNVTTPDTDGHPDPIELAVKIGGTLYALEHTGIEPFDNQIDLAKSSQALFVPLVEQIQQIVPAGEIYSLLFSHDAASKVKRKAHAGTREALLKWIVATAPTRPLHDAHRLDIGCQKLAVDGVPFPVSLTRQRRPNQHWCSVKVGFFPPEGEELRVQRIARAFAKKLPKLIAWKQKHHARAVLVFENTDIQLTNHIAVTDAVIAIAKDSQHRPDEIYLVESRHEPWQVIPVLVGDTSALELGENWCWQIASSELKDLTGRG
jgi:hypothetical protein